MGLFNRDMPKANPLGLQEARNSSSEVERVSQNNSQRIGSLDLTKLSPAEGWSSVAAELRRLYGITLQDAEDSQMNYIPYKEEVIYNGKKIVLDESILSTDEDYEELREFLPPDAYEAVRKYGKWYYRGEEEEMLASSTS